MGSLNTSLPYPSGIMLVCGARADFACNFLGLEGTSAAKNGSSNMQENKTENQFSVVPVLVENGG